MAVPSRAVLGRWGGAGRVRGGPQDEARSLSPSSNYAARFLVSLCTQNWGRALVPRPRLCGAVLPKRIIGTRLNAFHP
eukprot:11157276-Alexandrium_andersonii.AAC.1